MNKRRPTAVRIVLTALSAAFVLYIFWHSSLDAVESTEQSDAVMFGINGFLSRLGIGYELTEVIVRKSAHFTEYFVLGVLLGCTVYSYSGDALRFRRVAMPIGLGVAVCDELIQLFPQGRSCELTDMALDFSAVFIAVTILSLIIRKMIKKTDKEIEKYVEEEGRFSD